MSRIDGLSTPGQAGRRAETPSWWNTLVVEYTFVVESHPRGGPNTSSCMRACEAPVCRKLCMQFRVLSGSGVVFPWPFGTFSPSTVWLQVPCATRSCAGMQVQGAQIRIFFWASGHQSMHPRGERAPSWCIASSDGVTLTEIPIRLREKH